MVYKNTEQVLVTIDVNFAVIILFYNCSFVNPETHL